MYGTGPVFEGTGLICPVYSYVDTTAVSFTCGRAMMPDPDAFAAALRGAFEELCAAAGQPSAAPPVEAGKAGKKARKRKEG